MPRRFMSSFQPARCIFLCLLLAASFLLLPNATATKPASSEALRAADFIAAFPLQRDEARDAKQDAQRPVILELGKPIERELAGGQWHSYQIALTVGQYLQLAIEQRGINVTLVISGPDGKHLTEEADSSNGSTGVESASVVAETIGYYRLVVRSPEKETKSGRYEVKIAELRPATAQEQKHFAAQKTCAEAEQLSSGDTPNALRQAIVKYDTALPLWRAAGDQRNEARTLRTITYLYFNLDERKKSLEYASQMLAVYQSLNDRQGEAGALYHIGLCHFYLGELRNAIEYYQRALPVHHEIGDKVGEAFDHQNFGRTYRQLGEMRKAMSAHERAVSLFRELEIRDEEAAALSNMGLIYQSWGDKQKALDHFQQSIAIYDQIQLSRDRAIVSLNIGTIYSDLGQHQTALGYYQPALQVLLKARDRRSAAAALTNIGKSFSELGEKQRARDSYNQAITLMRAVGDASREAQALSNLAAVVFDMGDKPGARDYYDQSLALARNAGNVRAEISALAGIGRIQDDRGERQQAAEHFTQALRQAQAIGDRDSEARTWFTLARLDRKQDRLAQARTGLEQALEIIESIRANVVSQELRTSYFATIQGYYDSYIDLLTQLHQQEPLAGYNALALRASERARARSLLDLLVERRADIRQGVDETSVARERDLQQQLNAKGELLVRVKGDKRTENRAATLGKEIDEITNELQQVKATIRQKSPRYAALTQPQPVNLAEIQQQVLDPDSILLEYALAEERSFLWLVTPTSINSFELLNRATIEKAAQEVYDLLTVRTRCVKSQSEQAMPLSQVAQIEARLPKAAAELSQMLLGPVAAQLGTKRLLVVTEDALQSIPFGVLPIPKSEKEAADAAPRPLIAEHEIVSLPSASTLAVLRRELAGRKPAPKTVAVLADPVLEKSDLPRPQGVSQTRKPSAKAGNQTAAQAAAPVMTEVAAVNQQGAVRAYGVACAAMGMPSLPFSRKEAEAIEALVPKGEGQIWLGLDASRQKLLEADLSAFRIVHFATHGLLNSEHPEVSSIVLSLVDEKGAPQNGFLQMHEVFNLKLNADLVVLSACETALGKQINGEGRIGLTRGFMYAGAARVVASLWKVDDEATRDLMKVFYEKMLREKLSPAAALRAAQIEMISNPKFKRWRAPYFWGAFVLQGEYK